MSLCLKDIVIIDGWDDEDTEIVLRLVSKLFLAVKGQLEHNSHINQLLIIVVGSKGSRGINKEYLIHREKGTKREDIPLEVYDEVIEKTSEYAMLSKVGSVTIVPFLPLETDHVVQCIQKEFEYVRRLVDAGLITLKDKPKVQDLENSVLKSVLSRITFAPTDRPLVSASGCKRVLPSLRIVLGDIESYSSKLERAS